MTAQPELPFGVEPDTWWSDGAERAVRAMAATGRVFQMFDVAEEYALSDPPHHSQWGALASRLRKARVIEPVGFAASRRPTVAGSACRTWRGVCGGCGPRPSANRCESCQRADVREDRANDERTWS